MKNYRLSQSGSTLVALIIILPSLMLITAAYMQLTVNNLNASLKDQLKTHAQLAADAGIDSSMEFINLGLGWAGTAGEVMLHDDADVCVTYDVTVTNVSASQKTVTSIGRTYRKSCPAPADITKALSRVEINTTLRSVTSGDYSIVAGVGGLILENHAKVLGGDVHVNGVLSMKNHAQIGLIGSPVNLSVTNQVCPIPVTASYPRLCTTGENNNPISILDDAHIYGSVKANHQLNAYPSAMTNPGLTASSGVLSQTLPAHDRAAQIAAVTTTRTGTSASCITNSGSRVWEANTKIEGDVTISGNTINPCVVTIKGDVWITGKLTIQNGGKLVVSNLVLGDRPDVMIDGKDTVFKNSSRIDANTLGTGVQFITYWSSASCSPNCSTVTGSDLANSINEQTILLDNSASGLKAVFYAKWSKVLIANSGDVGALIGQTVHLKNSGTITFGSSVTGSLTFWVIDGYRRVF